MRFLTPHLTPFKTKLPWSLTHLLVPLWSRFLFRTCECDAGVTCSSCHHAEPRNGVLILKKTPINGGDKPVAQGQNAASASSAFSLCLQWEIWRHKPPLNLSTSVSVALLVIRERKWPPLAAGDLPTRAPQGLGSQEMAELQVQASKLSSANYHCRLSCMTK